MTTKITITVGEDEVIPVQVIVTEHMFNGGSQSSVTSIKAGDSQDFYIHQNRSLKVQELQLGAA